MKDYTDISINRNIYKLHSLSIIMVEELTAKQDEIINDERSKEDVESANQEALDDLKREDYALKHQGEKE